MVRDVVNILGCQMHSFPLTLGRINMALIFKAVTNLLSFYL